MKPYENVVFAAYARKSSTDDGKQVLSIEAQLVAIAEMARSLGIKQYHTFTDTGTAHEPFKRPNFMRMIELISKGEIRGILTWKADRLARNMVEGGPIIHSIQTGVLEVIKTPHAQYLPTDNMLPLTIELGMANQYSLDLSKNVKRGNKAKVSKGGHCGVAPQGYLNDVIDKTVYPDPDRFFLVRKMWDLMLTGVYSIPDICKIANEDWNFTTVQKRKQGGKAIRPSTLHAMFINSFYYGWVRKGENQNWGSHKPMITQAEFDKVQEILRRSGRKAVASYDFPFTGAIKCGECDCSITAEEKVKFRCPSCNKSHNTKRPIKCRCGCNISEEAIGKGRWYIYYHCTKKKGKCSQGSVLADELETQIDQKLNDIELDPDFEAWAMKWLKALNQETFAFKETEYKRFQRQYESSEHKLKNLIEMRASGELSKEEFLSIKGDAIQERELAKQKLADVDVNGDDWLKKAEEEIDFVIGVRKRFAKGSKKEKRFIFSKIGSNLLLTDGKLHVEAKPWFVAFKDLESVMDAKLEPPKTASISGISGLSGAPYTSWLPTR